jgi:hypothetical protein
VRGQEDVVMVHKDVVMMQKDAEGRREGAGGRRDGAARRDCVGHCDGVGRAEGRRKTS